MNEHRQFTSGSDIYVVERDDCGEPTDVSGYMFMAIVGRAVIVSPFIDGLESLEETIDYHIKETAENYDTDLAVFPLNDCFQTLDAAREAFNKEVNECVN